MPVVDLNDVRDFESFERAYDRLLAVLDGELTDDHKFADPATGELKAFHHESRLIGPEPKVATDYVSVRFLDDGSVRVGWSERNEADAWSFRYDVDQAMAMAILSVIRIAAQRYGQQNALPSGEDETVRLFRVLDDDWANHISGHSTFRSLG